MHQTINELLTGAATAVKDKKTPAQPEYQDECEIHGRTIKPIREIEDLTPEWLSIFLDRKIAEDGWTLKPVGTGQMSSTIKVTFHEVDKPDVESLVVKFASSDKVTREMGLKFNHYRREVGSYQRPLHQIFTLLRSDSCDRCADHERRFD